MAEKMTDKVEVINLNQMIEAEPTKGASFKLYRFNKDGFHYGPQWFTSGHIRYPKEEITAEAALLLAETWMSKGLEVRVTDGGDFLIFQAMGKHIVYPKNTTLKQFWSLL